MNNTSCGRNCFFLFFCYPIQFSLYTDCKKLWHRNCVPSWTLSPAEDVGCESPASAATDVVVSTLDCCDTPPANTIQYLSRVDDDRRETDDVCESQVRKHCITYQFDYPWDINGLLARRFFSKLINKYINKVRFSLTLKPFGILSAIYFRRDKRRARFFRCQQNVCHSSTIRCLRKLGVAYPSSKRQQRVYVTLTYGRRPQWKPR